MPLSRLLPYRAWMRSSRTRLTLLFGGASLLVALVLALYVDRLATQRIVQARGEALLTVSRPIADALAEGLRERERDVSLLARYPLLTAGPLDSLPVRAYLDDLKQSFPDYSWIGVTDVSGQVRSATGGLLQGESVRQRPWFSAGLQGLHVGDAHEAQLLAQLIGSPKSTEPLRFLDFAAPIRSNDGRLLGVAAAHLNWHWVSQLVQRATSGPWAPEGLELLIVSENGTVLHPYGQSELMRSAATPPALGSFRVLRWGAQGDYLTAAVQVPSLTAQSLHWTLIVRQPLALALAPVSELHRLIATLALVLTGVLMGMIYWIAQRFSQPLERLARMAQHLDQTGEGAQFDIPANTLEFAHLRDSLRKLTQHLLESQKELRLSNQGLEHKVEQRTQEIQLREQQYRSILEEQSEVICRFRADLTLTYVNEAYCRLFALRREEVLGSTWSPVVYPEDIERVRLSLSTNSPAQPVSSVENRVLAGNGQVRWFHFINHAFFDEQGHLIEWQSVGRDITERQALEQTLQRVSSEQEAMLDNDLLGIARIKDRRVVWRNRALERIFGYEPGALLDQPTERLYASPEDHEAFGREAYATLASGQHFRRQMPMRRANGDTVWMDLNGVRLSEDSGESLWLLQDITEMKQYQAQVEHIAFHDPLTLLPNRLLLSDRMRQAFALHERAKTVTAVCYLDLNGFKAVNDQHGHEAGDHLLKEMAKRLLEAVRAHDTVARLGGDEFVLLLSSLHQSEEARLIIQRVEKAIRQPVRLANGAEVQVSTSVGVAFHPQDGTQPGQLLALADSAMYEAKRRLKVPPLNEATPGGRLEAI
ncbi:diguanylate cyclase [Curvibacter sp. HBC28]|uniref:Diguanylate cyclase n=2 Tax=Curvibacter microcysteis TaxID=3026419 RepID=A0ABT5MEB8_9BURK|nr:diguanylate cyclase [Curvibacter sp. HBC28]